MAPTNSNAQGVTTPGTTSAHGRNGFVGSRHILPAAAGQQEVQLTTDQQQAFDQLAPIFRGRCQAPAACSPGLPAPVRPSSQHG